MSNLGQGVKICPQVNLASVSVPHSVASHALLQARLRVDLETAAASTSPNHLIFQKTAAFIAAIRALGCHSSECDQIRTLPASEQQQQDFLDTRRFHIQRGYRPLNPKCPGRLSLQYNHQGKPLVVCEFHSPANRFHLCRFIDEAYDLDYLEAFFNEDDDELQRIEEAAAHQSFDHRDELGRLIQLPMKLLTCGVKFVVYEPLEQFRQACPYVLLVCTGDSHPHPIPLPRKTPRQIQDDIAQLLKSLDGDLADLTPRRFLRHPILRAYLQQKFPQIPTPTICDLHTSLANREHLRVYINAAKVDLFPHGTGWNGVICLKQWQDENLPVHEHYIRCIMDLADFPTDEFDCDSLRSSSGSAATTNLRLIVCMSPQGSHRLIKSQYLQSDIAFQRVEGFYEFEIATMDTFANTSVIFLRIYLNRQTAAAHKLVMDAINDVVKGNTGRAIQWRHIHATSPADTPNGMVLLWTTDQHGGQTKGESCIGLHLQEVAQGLVGKHDLHEPERLLSSLSPYEHLHRVFRVCNVHGKRNIRSCPVSEEVRNLMRSLMCLRHPDWEGTVAAIRLLGGKAGEDWVQDKIRSKFAFEGWCWEKSHIPEAVWRAGQSHSNLIESVHADVNREGTHCTLLGGLKKGQAFDALKMKTLQTFEDYSIRPSYKSGHPIDNALKSLKRKSSSHHRHLGQEDAKISTHYGKIQKSYDAWQQAFKAQQIAAGVLRGVSDLRTSLHNTRQQEFTKAHQSCERAEAKYKKDLEAGKALQGMGSGKVEVWVPPM
ncbi:hypothetical protein B0H14DRAFT_3132843 [Mycena olivaceomarginata]|nr:hypothetical protein B0H14DRAFT_3132843 [Mycena olivaceomarginata]